VSNTVAKKDPKCGVVSLSHPFPVKIAI